MEAVILNIDKLLTGEGHYRETRHCLHSDVSLLNPDDGSPAQTLPAVLLHVSEFESQHHDTAGTGKMSTMSALHLLPGCTC